MAGPVASVARAYSGPGSGPPQPVANKHRPEPARGPVITACRQALAKSIYEPETWAFGGTDGMATAHDVFCADSPAALAALAATGPRAAKSAPSCPSPP